MTASDALPKVLDRIDNDLNASLDRLFALLRIQSVSTDPAYATHCRSAAEHVAADLRGLGFEVSVRPTAGHPAIVAKIDGNKANGNAGRPHVLFYGHYDVQPVDPLNLWHRPPFEPVVTDKLESIVDKVGSATVTEVDDDSATATYSGAAPAKVGDAIKNQ